MHKIILLVILSSFFMRPVMANHTDTTGTDEMDTTSVRIFFDYNEYTLSAEEKDVANSIIPSDTSILLKNIRIYGYSDSSEKEDKKTPLSLLRANVIKQYLLDKGIAPALIGEVAGKGKQNRMTDTTTDTATAGRQNRSVLVLIEYEPKVTEQTIIISSSPKKKDE
jgi:outer membrane protein OmpA-like peptidoglycan-associated protein